MRTFFVQEIYVIAFIINPGYGPCQSARVSPLRISQRKCKT